MRLRSPLAVLVCAAILASCGPTSAPATSAVASSPAASAASPAPSSPAATAVQLNATRLSDIGTYVFHPARFHTGNQYMLLQLVYNSLIKADADEQTIIADLADSWEISPDATTFTFKLHPGVKWHDGTPFTSADVVFTVAQACQWYDTDAAKANELWVGTYPITNWLSVKGCDTVKGTTNTPEGVTAPDDNTVVFTLAAPNAEFLSNLRDPAYMITPKHILESATPETLRDLPFAKAPIGTGPFKWVSLNEGQFIEFEAYADYHKGAPKIQKLIWKDKVNPDVGAAQLQAGELDLVFDLRPTDKAALDQDANVQTFQIAGVGQQSLQFNLKDPLVQDVRVRQAIYYGFDRKSLLENQFDGAGRLLWVSAGFNPDGPGLDKYEYDLEKAKGLLQAATADGKFDPSAKFGVTFIEAEPGWPQIAAAVEQGLKQIGITNVELQPLDDQGWTAKVTAGEGYAITLQCCGSPGISPDRDSTLYTGAAGTFYKNDDLTAKFEAARAIGDPAARKTAYEEIAQILNKEVPYVWLWAVANTHAATKRLSNFEPYPNARESFSQIETWELAPAP